MRLIDADNIDFVILEDSLHRIEHKKGDEVDCVIGANEVKAIPKDQYETRLKADMVAMLTEIQLEIEEIPNSYEHKPIGTYDYCFGAENERKVNLEIIQQKIDKLKEVEQ